MCQQGVSMRKISEVARLKFCLGLSDRAIARSCQVSPTTVASVLRGLEAHGITTWEGYLVRQLAESAPAAAAAPFPDMATMLRELKRHGVTRHGLWKEYRKTGETKYSYSRFCARFRALKKAANPVLRFTHLAGEKVFVDYSGKRPEIVDQLTGEVTKVELFVSALGASSYIYAEATLDQTRSSFIGSQVRMFGFFGGVTVAIVIDNLRAGVTRADYYDPDINPAYQEFAKHYGVAVLPARPYEPRDKAAVENAVQQAQRWILAPLRDRTFFSLDELNTAIREQVRQLNAEPFTGREGSRAELFATIDKPALRPLPEHPYEFAEWKMVTVHIDYHIDLARVFYSAPYRFIGRKLMCRYTTGLVQLFDNATLVATHRRGYKRGTRHTLPEHRPAAHDAMLAWTPERMRDWGGKIGPNTVAVVDEIFSRCQHSDQGYRLCLGILGLTRYYPANRLEQASRRALDDGCFRVKYFRNLLKNRLESASPATTTEPARGFSQAHAHLRGGEYYQDQLPLEVDDEHQQSRN